MIMRHSLTIVVPALNEEENIIHAVDSMRADLRRADIDWELIIVDDGSADRTPEICDELSRAHAPHIRVIHHRRPLGIGAGIRDGVRAATKNAVTWLPGDGENDPYEIIKYTPLLEHVDFIVPFVINKDARSRRRQFLSRIYRAIVNATFGTSFNYTNGNVIYKRTVFDVVRQESSGFFFQTECLVKAARAGFIFAEVPIRIRTRLKGRSKAITWRSLKAVVRDYVRLVTSIFLKQSTPQGETSCP